MFNSIGEAKLEDFDKYAPETVRRLCEQSERNAKRVKDLIETVKLWKLQAVLGWGMFLVTIAMTLINQK